jgi:4-hydroxy-3-polyprenylbenzoate decarboxylase
MPLPIVIGITGASGAAYAVRVIELLAAAEVETHLAISALGKRLLFDELDIKRIDADQLTRGRGKLLIVHNDNDLGAAIASGSFLHQGMIIVPCSSNTMGKVAAGITDNLVQRAASVTLKERRRLVLGYRESPMSHIDLLNMQRLSEAGAIIAPLAPGFYLLPQTIDDLVDFMAGKLLDLVGVPHDLATRWAEKEKVQSPKSKVQSPKFGLI